MYLPVNIRASTYIKNDKNPFLLPCIDEQSVFTIRKPKFWHLTFIKLELIASLVKHCQSFSELDQETVGIQKKQIYLKRIIHYSTTKQYTVVFSLRLYTMHAIFCFFCRFNEDEVRWWWLIVTCGLFLYCVPVQWLIQLKHFFFTSGSKHWISVNIE